MQEQVPQTNIEHIETLPTDTYGLARNTSKEIKRIDKAYVISEISSVLNFKKGIFYTLKGLLVQPGKIIRHFLFYDRKKLVKPITFVFFCSFLSVLANGIFELNSSQLEDPKISDPEIAKKANTIKNLLEQNTDFIELLSGNNAILSIISAFFIAWWLSVFFKKYRYTIYELLVVSCYTIGIIALIDVIITLIAAMFYDQLILFSMLTSTIYATWSIGNFFNTDKKSYLKAAAAYIMGMTTGIIVFFVLIGALLARTYFFQ